MLRGGNLLERRKKSIPIGVGGDQFAKEIVANPNTDPIWGRGAGLRQLIAIIHEYKCKRLRARHGSLTF
jgi:hypothetical protein